MPQYYGGAPNAFAGGMEYGAEMRARLRKENALKALIQQYGPTAADPQSHAAMQAIGQREDLHPYDVSTAQHQQALQPHVLAEAQRVDAARAAAVAARGAPAGDPAGERQGIEIEETKNAERLSAARRAAAGLQYVHAKGGDLGAAFDRIVPLLPALGIPAEKLPEARAAFINDPEELIAVLTDPAIAGRGSMAAPRRVFNRETQQFEMWQQDPSGQWKVMPGLAASEDILGTQRNVTAEGNLGERRRALTIRERENLGLKATPGMQYEVEGDINDPNNRRIIASAIPGTEQELKVDEARTELETRDYKFLNTAGVVTANKEIVDREVTRALPYFKGTKAGPVMQTLRMGLQLIPGTDAGNASDAIQEIKNKVSIDALQQMRANSPTGGAMGAISDRDISILESALGRLETTRDPKRMVEDLNFITREYKRIVDLAQKDASRAAARLKGREGKLQTQFGAPGSAAPGDIPDVSGMSTEALFRIMTGTN